MICGTEMAKMKNAALLWNNKNDQKMLAAFSQLKKSQREA